MAMELKNSRTWQNLQTAWAGETEACVKYMYYASQAKKDGYQQMAAIFEETSDNEKAHAKMWFKLLHGGSVAGTPENLRDAVENERYEWSDMYKRFAAEAREEGFDEIAESFEGVGTIEKEHEERYAKLLQNIEYDVVFKSDKVTVWKCRNCGNIYVGEEAPEVCPVCKHPQAYYEIRAENY